MSPCQRSCGAPSALMSRKGTNRLWGGEGGGWKEGTEMANAGWKKRGERLGDGAQVKVSKRGWSEE